VEISSENAASLVFMFCITVSATAQGGLPGHVTAPTELASTAVSQDQTLLLVLDRNKIGEGETAALNVVVSGASFLDGGLETYHSDALQFTELPESDPAHLKRYAVKASRAGEYSILVRAAVKPETNEAATGRRLIRTVVLTVNAKRGIVAGNAGAAILGAILGALGSFWGVYFKDVVERWAAKRNRFLWLTNEFVGRLEAARLDVKRRRTVNYQPWMEELYSKHFSALRSWEGTPEAGETLSREVIQIEGLLREYNQSLSGVAVDDDVVADLDQRMVRVQRTLSRTDTTL
jgi:hypothetical protein